MRINPEQTRLITQCIHHHLGDAARAWLFGSRLNDDQRGGDKDLYMEKLERRDYTIVSDY